MVSTTRKGRVQESRTRGKELLFRALRQKFSILLGFLVLAPCLMLLILRVVPPPSTAFMAERYITGMLEEKKGRGIRYQWVPLDSISPHAALAVVAAEDQKFPRHWGFDFQSIRRLTGNIGGRALSPSRWPRIFSYGTAGASSAKGWKPF
jgi:monofunctional biosynthetic peptidoglycan transglycosylase